MTMPNERTRALRQAGELLRTIKNRPDVPADLREQALWTLRHYPEPSTIEAMASETPDGPSTRWLAPEDA